MTGAASRWRGYVLPDGPALTNLHKAAEDWEVLVQAAMELIVGRDAADPDYGWIDTKVDPLTGRDWPEDDPVRGRRTVYGWIQGRGLEALAGHVRWFRDSGAAGNIQAAGLAVRLEEMLRRLLARLLEVRRKNSGHLFFFFTPDGDPFVLEKDGRHRRIRLIPDTPAGFSDLFAAKGILSAALLTGDAGAAQIAREWLADIADQIYTFRFRSDQQTLDPKNPQHFPPGRRAQAPFMILLGAAALWMELEDSPEALRIATACAGYVLRNHVNLNGRLPGLPENAFWEFTDIQGRPWTGDGQVVSDPGHALEFAGLAGKFLRAARRRGRGGPELDELEAALPALLDTNFELGWQEEAQGICKTVDLVSRRPINTDMPWWNLPETMRAALLIRATQNNGGAEQGGCLRIVARCSNALDRYVRPEHGLLIVQTRSAEGVAVPVIPATSDLDPGYHTGLSLIDCLNLLQKGPGEELSRAGSQSRM